METNFAVILAGGKGERLWPLSRQNHPKQFAEFKEGLSLFQLTIKRVLSVFAAKNVFIVTQESYKFTVYNQVELLKNLSRKTKRVIIKNIILEPVSKNTLPAVLLSMKNLEQRQDFRKSDLMFVFPSDHIIEPLVSFKSCIRKAQRLARMDKIVVFGAKPNFPKKAFGYILTKGKINGGFSVDKFVEKPNLKEAKELLKKGAYWNAGIFCFSKNVFLQELKSLAPAFYKFYNLPLAVFIRRFRNITGKSIDYGIMQLTRHAALVKFSLNWSDLGTWDSFLQFYSNGRKNFKIGKAEFLESKNCFAYSNNRLTCLVGLKDVIAINSPDSTLLIKKGQTDKVKDLVSRINKKGYIHSRQSPTVYRPWGYYTVLNEEAGYKVKEIGIYPRRSLSLQKHKYRSEHWNIVCGKAHVFIDGRRLKAKKNESIFVPKNTKHKIYNPCSRTTKIIEVQIGNYIGEDDIRRFDAYV